MCHSHLIQNICASFKHGHFATINQPAPGTIMRQPVEYLLMGGNAIEESKQQANIWTGSVQQWLAT